ncbi:MAG: LamG-like jellyroll fold domain-containing protein [Opitutaceae bacterium]|nr:LamG-like jellyroll fold domain-containing protein [Opitutaceae bacterium]
MSDPASSLSAMELDRLAELAEKLRANALADAEVAELESLLAESAAARTAFAELAMLTAELRHTHGRHTFPVPTETRPGRLVTFFCQRWLPLAAAACLALAALGVWRYGPARSTAHGGPIATITNASGAVLLADDRATDASVGATLRGGALHLRSGLLELTYPSGVVLVLESPARFDLRSATTLWLAAGNVSARVPGPAVEFTIETPSASIVDLGTEFGVSVGATGSEVHVFKGEVLIKNKNEPDSLRLTENRASRIDTQTRTPTGIDYQPERFLRTLDEPGSSYRDLIRQYDPIAYYRMRITPEATLLLDVTRSQLNGRIVLGSSQHAFATGRIGAGLRLGGPAPRSYAYVPDFPKAPAAALTVCAWVRAESRPRWASIAKNWAKDVGSNRGGQFHFGLFHDEGSLEVHVHDEAGREVWVQDREPLPLGEWQFVAFTLDGSTLRLYRNGREIDSTPCRGLTQTAPAALALGVKLDASGTGPETNTPGFWDGTLDEVAIFHRTLSPAQLLALYDTAR